MITILGLGNPGNEYLGHRHNIGFMAIDRIAERCSIGPFRSRFQGLAAEGRIGSSRVLLLKPQTFMNQSGRSAREAMNFYKFTLDQLIVLYDELDLAPGKVRVRKGGGAAGHNGIRSLTQHCGSDFWRVRIGIGHPGSPDRVTGYVLSNFSKSDQEWVQPLLDAIGDNAELLCSADHSNFMNRIAIETQSSIG
jgi:PTH1 family peptidyl-tRNA hydrolase